MPESRKYGLFLSNDERGNAWCSSCCYWCFSYSSFYFFSVFIWKTIILRNMRNILCCSAFSCLHMGRLGHIHQPIQPLIHCIHSFIHLVAEQAGTECTARPIFPYAHSNWLPPCLGFYHMFENILLLLFYLLPLYLSFSQPLELALFVPSTTITQSSLTYNRRLCTDGEEERIRDGDVGWLDRYWWRTPPPRRDRPHAITNERIKTNGRAQFNTWPFEPFVNCVQIESVLQHRTCDQQLVIRSSLWYCVDSGWSTRTASANWTGINWQLKRPEKRLLANWLTCFSSSVNITLSFLASRLLLACCILLVGWSFHGRGLHGDWWTIPVCCWDIISQSQRQMNVSICISYLYSRVLTPTYTYE